MIAAEHEFKLDGHTYRASRLSAFDQLHVASQWRDAMLGLSLLKKNRPKDITDAAYRESVRVIVTGGLSRITAQSREEISKLLMSVVTRQNRGQQGIGWSPVSAADGTLMFADIQLPQMVHIIYMVMDHNGIIDFFSEGPSNTEKDGPQEETGHHSQTGKAG